MQIALSELIYLFKSLISEMAKLAKNNKTGPKATKNLAASATNLTREVQWQP